MIILTLPNCLSLSRVALSPVIVWAILSDLGVVAIGIFFFAVISDVVDGIIARRLQQVSALGTMLDHGSDAVFVVAVTAACATLDLLPSLLAPLIAIAFVQYLLDSRLLGGAELRSSRIGQWNGIAYFVLAGLAIAIYHFTSDPNFLTALRALGWLLVATSLVSIADRALHFYRSRNTD